MSTPNYPNFDFTAYDTQYRQEQRVRLEELSLAALALSANLKDRLAIVSIQTHVLDEDIRTVCQQYGWVE